MFGIVLSGPAMCGLVRLGKDIIFDGIAWNCKVVWGQVKYCEVRNYIRCRVLYGLEWYCRDRFGQGLLSKVR